MSWRNERLLRTGTFRQALQFALLFGVAMTALVGAIYAMLDYSLKANLMREVNDDLATLRMAYATAPHGKEQLEVEEIIVDRVLAPDVDGAFLIQRGRQRLAGNLPAMPYRLGTFSVTLPKSASHGGRRPSVVLGQGMMLGQALYVFVGRNLDDIEAVETRVIFAFAVVLAAGLALALVNGLLLSRAFLRRIDTVNATCRSIMAGRLEERIAAAGNGDEFDRLGGAINDMLDRIQVLMESLRQVSNDIAHDMRTPLTHLRHRLERIRGEATTPAEYAAAVDGAVRECDKLLAVFTALLRIAQIEAGARRSEFRAVDFVALIGKVRDIYAPVMEDAARRFEVRADPVPPVSGDEQLLLQLIVNLLNNALAHTPDGTAIFLDCHAQNDAVVLAVADCGPGIAAPERDKVLRRFYRCEQSRTKPGSGLGLALVAAVVHLHDAALTLADNAPGLRVSLRFRPMAIDPKP